MSHRPQARALLFSLLSGVILVFPFSNSNYWIFAWFGFIPLFFALQNQPRLKTFLLGYLTGVVFWSGTIYWLVHVTVPGTIILIFYLALYFGVFALLIRTHLQLTTYNLPLFVPSVWVLLEYLRSYLFTGFPWALLGYSQYKILPVIQIADITGAWGVSFLVMMVNAAVYYLVARRASHATRKSKILLLPLALVLIVLTYGFYRINVLRVTCYVQPITISVIQGNIPQELKWAPGAKDFIVGKYVELTERATAENPHLIIWPEAASPVVLGEDRRTFEKFGSLAKDINTPLLIGTLVNEDGDYFNSAVLFNEKGQIEKRYDKLHLVPFGEYIPLRKMFPFLESFAPIGDVKRGEDYTIFEVKNPKLQSKNQFGVLICFEDLFPELSRGFVKNGAEFLVNITNDAWYMKTSAAFQHLQAAVFRAVENRVILVRCANTGVSAFISPSGKITALLQDNSGQSIFVEGFLSQKMSIAKVSPTLYCRYADIFILLLALFIFYFIIQGIKKSKAK